MFYPTCKKIWNWKTQELLIYFMDERLLDQQESL